MTASQRGGRFYDVPEARQQYLRRRHSGVTSPNHVMEEPALLEALGPCVGLRVLDLGCGDAAIGRILLDGGCRGYLGLDGSVAMVEEARAMLRGTSGRVERMDMEEFAVARNSFCREASPAAPGSLDTEVIFSASGSFDPKMIFAASGAFDLVVSRLALHYVDDVEAVLAACHACLAPGGRVVFTVVHPVLTSHDAGTQAARTNWVVDDYFVQGPRQRNWLGGTVTWFHRTIEDYVRVLRNTGFSLTSLRECAPREDRFNGDQAELERRRRVPLFLLVAGART
ncbi:class I SAM-dependent methyltransferase [Nonomuraea sp. NPDC005983]|uniref:class I SAM-dependent methyltransferase n=1 Tax=Nonomuraea sp. NPDC005983 TaxID=3155595 RepID=UPI0033A47D3B